MPIHDWTSDDAGIVHHFHSRWMAAITHTLNDGLLPPEQDDLADPSEQSATREPMPSRGAGGRSGSPPQS